MKEEGIIFVNLSNFFLMLTNVQNNKPDFKGYQNIQRSKEKSRKRQYWPPVGKAFYSAYKK